MRDLDHKLSLPTHHITQTKGKKSVVIKPSILARSKTQVLLSKKTTQVLLPTQVWVKELQKWVLT